MSAGAQEKAPVRQIDGVEELKTFIGRRIGESPWVTVDQELINAFADATFDHNFIHVDPVRAAATPFGTTIAHGYHSLALIGGLIQETFRVTRVRMGLNYGIEKARFPQAVPVGSRVRLLIDVTDVVDTPTDDSVNCQYHVTVEIEGAARPACVADVIFRYYPAD